jgi:hypothetical protein
MKCGNCGKPHKFSRVLNGKELCWNCASDFSRPRHMGDIQAFHDEADAGYPMKQHKKRLSVHSSLKSLVRHTKKC